MSDLVDLQKTRPDHAQNWLARTIGGAMPVDHVEPVDVNEWTLDFDFAKNPIPMNGSRGSHYAHAKKVKQVRTMARRYAEVASIPDLGRLSAQLTWYVIS